MSLLERIAPGWALSRQKARAQLGVLATFNTGGASSANVGASQTRRSMKSWIPSLFRDADSETLPERQTLVARSRDAFRNQTIARGAVQTMLTSVIGGGLEFHCRIDRKFIGFSSDEEATAWEQRVERLFRAWANSTDADAGRKNTFYRLQSLAYKSSKHSGEIFALLPLIPRKGTICDLRVQLVETDRVSTPTNLMNAELPNGNVLWDGIETGAWSEPVAYYVETTLPNPVGELSRDWKRVLAYGQKSGRRQVIHFFEQDRPGQRRGLPMLTPILEMLKQISTYSDAELMAAVISGMFTVFVKHAADPTADILPGVGTTDDRSDSNDISLGSGAIIDLNEGESIETANPGRPNQQFGPFVQEIIRQIGMGLNIPYEVLTKQFNSSYSASRAAIMQAWEVFNVEREWFVQEFLQPIYVEWLSQMVATGRVDAPGFFDSVEIQRAYSGAAWYGPVPLQIDPVREANGMEIRLRNRVTTLAEETERYGGGDWEQNLAQCAREQKLKEDLKLVSEPATTTPDNPVLPE